jgi:hypothetical protein
MTGEAAMYSTIHHEIGKARVADKYQQAQRDTQARAVLAARHALKQQSGRPAPRLTAVTARRLLSVLHPRST